MKKQIAHKFLPNFAGKKPQKRNLQHVEQRNKTYCQTLKKIYKSKIGTNNFLVF